MKLENGVAEAALASTIPFESRKWIVPYCAALFGMMMLQISNMGFSPLMPGIQESWGLNFSQVGLFTGINGLSSLIMAVPAGLLIHRFGEKSVLCWGLLVVVIGLSIVAVSTNFSMGIAGRTIWQFGYKATFISCVTALSLALPSHLKATGMGINGSLSCLATAVGAPLGGFLALNYSWKAGMWGYAVLALLGLLVFSLVYSSPGKSAEKGSRQEMMHGAAKPRSAFRTPIVYVLSLLMFLGMMAGISLTLFLPTALKHLYQFTAMDTAATISMGFVLGIPVVLFLGVFADRIKNRRLTLTFVMGLTMVMALLMTSSNPTLLRFGAIVILALGLSVPNLLYAMAGEILAGRDVGNVMGMVGFGGGVSAFFGPQVLGWLGDITGTFMAGWYFIAAVSALFCVVIQCLKVK